MCKIDVKALTLGKSKTKKQKSEPEMKCNAREARIIEISSLNSYQYKCTEALGRIPIDRLYHNCRVMIKHLNLSNEARKIHSYSDATNL